MKLGIPFRTPRVAPAAWALVPALVLAGTAVAAAVSAGIVTPSNAVTHGRGIDQFGLTRGSMRGARATLTYSKGFVCDTSVPSASSTGCEAGSTYHHAPVRYPDELFITIPLGFTVPQQECPATLVCVDHPGTIDLTRLARQLKPLYPAMTDAELTTALRDVPAPGHDHLLRVTGSHRQEWWNVIVIGVTDPQVYRRIVASHDYATVSALLQAKDRRVIGPVPTNIFLRFAAEPTAARLSPSTHVMRRTR